MTSPKARQKPWHPLKTTTYIHHTNHSTRSPFLHTQLQIKTTLKRRIQLQVPPAQHARPHNLPQRHHPLSHWNVKSTFKSQNSRTRKSSPPPLMLLSLTHQHSNNHLHKNKCLHLLSLLYFQERLWSCWASSCKSLER